MNILIVFDLFIFSLYRFFFLPLSLFFLQTIYLLWPNKISNKIKSMLEERKDLIYPNLPSRPIWIHAASGEIEYAKPVIRELKILLPQVPILVTYFSPSAKKIIQNFPGIDVAVPCPWDTLKNVKKFLTHFQPRAALFARTDVWPEMAYQLSRINIPSSLFSATFASNSRRKGFLSGALNRWALNHINQIFCCSSEDEINLRNLGVSTNIETHGDTRYDQVVYRLNHPENLRRELAPSSTDLIFVAGSTWPEDELILAAALSESYKKNWRWIWAPHEISESHLQELEKLISLQGICSTRYTKTKSWESSQVLIIDKIGVLPEIYTWGKLAFVGGSFKDKVHSVMEPLAAGLPVLVGPFFKNNREALLFQKFPLTSDFFSVQTVHTSKDFINIFNQSLHNDFQKTLRDKVIEFSGTSKKMAKWVENFQEKY